MPPYVQGHGRFPTQPQQFVSRVTVATMSMSVTSDTKLQTIGDLSSQIARLHGSSGFAFYQMDEKNAFLHGSLRGCLYDTSRARISSAASVSSSSCYLV